MNPAAVLVELDLAVNQGEQGPVATDTHILARMKLGAALPDDDAAGGDGLGAESLDAQTLGIAIAPVTGTALTFLVCHKRGELKTKWKNDAEESKR